VNSQAAFAKSKGDTYIGVFTSQSNPPIMFEFMTILQCITGSLLDKVAYVVIDGESDNRYFDDTREHRIAMAKLAVATYNPFIVSAKLGKNASMTSEDMAFELFALNSDLRFTLFHISRATDCKRREETVNRLAANIGNRLCGFDPNRHRVVALFVGEDPRVSVDVEQRAYRYVRAGQLGVEYVPTMQPHSFFGRNIGEFLLIALQQEHSIESALLGQSVARYISQHEDYRIRLMDYLSTNMESV
jgi:hypothetical protein